MLLHTLFELGEFHFIGDTIAQGIDDALSGEEIASRRRMVDGLESAHEDFICRKRPFALAGD